MSAVATIRLNRMELKLADTDDPVAQKTSWDPTKPGGANFKTHELVATPGALCVKHSAGGMAFAGAFAGFGALFVLIGLSILFLDGQFGGLLFAAVGSLFVFAGLFLLKREAPLTFDLRAGVYFRGKTHRSRGGPRDVQGPLASIHALQVLQERIRSSSSSGGAGSFTSHELNLVFADGSRVNVLDHGHGDAVLDAAKQLGSALDVPIWQASY
ncbi:hypothetical protein [Cognatilysobacter bugurensis]|uniref:Uncharacterized protein n=1 Tax=Cognatilysobacter bugurensis TaxID=543356 RepID=A0A918T247_9GAMM|nr:hypothetical protein [Lysobacter bugurensis]GHA83387.1 hypothetical protein GCM10007067_21880 [Lysobacter bugurensis]